jgi:hypothetical protein
MKSATRQANACLPALHACPHWQYNILQKISGAPTDIM